MQNIRLRIAYEGTDYGGFQIQKNAVTVQEKLEKALKEVYGKKIRITFAGRTDAGTHARGQVINYKAEPLLPLDRICWALNNFLPQDIVAWEAAKAPECFHSSYDALSKVYHYTIDTAIFIQVLRRRYAWHSPDKLNIKLMREGAEILLGRHDFRVFQGTGTEVKETFRTIFRSEIIEKKESELIIFRVEGDGFLYKMVRFMTGALVEMGKGALSGFEMEDALKGSTLRIGPALPAKGLCLEKVIYAE